MIGQILKLSTWGESHGVAIGGVIEGFPSQFVIDKEQIDKDLRRRSTGISSLSSSRKECDEVEFLSGVKDGITLGTPIAFVVRNKDARSTDYDDLADVFRPSHADYTYYKKYSIRDHRGGGRASARETVARVIAGSLAKQWLLKKGILVAAYTQQIGDIALPNLVNSVSEIYAKSGIMGTLGDEYNKKMFDLVSEVMTDGDSVGGIARCIIEGVTAGYGEPVFDKLEARLAHAILSIPACKGFDYGSGFSGVCKRGSELNDELYFDSNSVYDKVRQRSNNSGGILGGISNGETIYFRAAFKPIASIRKEQSTINECGESTTISIKGRHDVSVFPRVLPIVEAMAALVIMDLHLLNEK